MTNRGLLQPQGELYPIQTIFNHRSRDQLLEFHTSFYETISSEFLVQGNFKHTQFSREHCWYWRDSNSQPLAPKATRGGHSHIMELRIRVNKNVEKGSDFCHRASSTFLEIRGQFSTTSTLRVSILNNEHRHLGSEIGAAWFNYLIWFNYLTFSFLKLVLFKSEPIFNDNDAQNNTNNVPFWYHIPV